MTKMSKMVRYVYYYYYYLLATSEQAREQMGCIRSRSPVFVHGVYSPKDRDG